MKKPIHYQLKEGAFCRQDFESFLMEVFELTKIDIYNSYVIVLDNARIHHGLSLPDNSPEIVFLPPYSPFLNPIESVFSVIKCGVKKDLCWINSESTQPERKKKLYRSISQRTEAAKDFACFYRHCKSYLTRCLLMEDIFGD